MTEQRKLAAIMFTDIVGYTALMSKDEQKAHQIIQKSRDLLKSLIEQYNGEWLQAVGDGTLSSFSSVVDAVNCALEIQRSLRDEPELISAMWCLKKARCTAMVSMWLPGWRHWLIRVASVFLERFTATFETSRT